jgi:hypothetical protein
MNSAPFAPNSSCATSQGSRSSGAPTRVGSGTAVDGSAAAVAVAANASRPGSFVSRLATKYSGFSARQRACACRLRSPWHASAVQTRCRSPWRVLGKYHRRQIRHGRLRFTQPSSPGSLSWLGLSAHAPSSVLSSRGSSRPLGQFSQADPGQFSRAPKERRRTTAAAAQRVHGTRARELYQAVPASDGHAS